MHKKAVITQEEITGALNKCTQRAGPVGQLPEEVRIPSTIFGKRHGAFEGLGGDYLTTSDTEQAYTAGNDPKFGLVLSGGGARGAYEAGVMYYLRTAMPPEIARSSLFSIFTGTSIGAVNSTFCASSAHDPIYQGVRLRHMWGEITDESIYRSDCRALGGFLVASATFMAAKFFGLESMLGKRSRKNSGPFPFRGILNLAPLRDFLRKNVHWSQLHDNISSGVIDAAAVSTTHMMSGQVAVFVEKHGGTPYRPGGSHATFSTLTADHALASGSIPLLFPPVRIDGQYYGDGSLRQNTPISPAVHLGADRLLVVSTLYMRNELPPPGTRMPPADSEPTVGDVLGTYLDSIFVEKLDYDLEQMRRVNSLIEDIEALYGPRALLGINARRLKRAAAGEPVHALQKIVPLVITPSHDIGALAYDHFTRLLSRRKSLTPIQKFFSRVIEGSPDTHNDLVSYLMFDHDYLESLIQLGFEDARRQHDRLVDFFSNRPLEDVPHRAAASSQDMKSHDLTVPNFMAPHAMGGGQYLLDSVQRSAAVRDRISQK